MRRTLFATIGLLAALAGCGSPLSAPPHDSRDRITEITAIAFAEADSAGTGKDGVVTASVVLTASDPAMVRLYGWPPEHVAAVKADLDRDGGKLGRWAIGPLVSFGAAAGPSRAIRLQTPAKAGWLYALTIDPLSTANGGTFAAQAATVEIEG